MAFDPHANFILFSCAIAPSPASSGTSLYLNDADAANFPDPASGNYNVTVFPAGANPLISNAEIVRFTAKSSANVDGLGHTRFTIIRQQESSNARSIVIGDNVMIAVTKKSLTDIESQTNTNTTNIATNTTNISSNTSSISTLNGRMPSGTVVGTTDTQTLSSKRMTKRTVPVTQSATPTINTDNVDVAYITALAQAITSMTTNLTGTPNANDVLIISITDNGSPQGITWGSSFESSGNVPLPSTTVGGVRLDIGFLWNVATSKWRCVAVA